MLHDYITYDHYDACGNEREGIRVHKVHRLVVQSYNKSDDKQNSCDTAHDGAVSYHLGFGIFVEIENVEPAFSLREYKHERDHERHDDHKPGRRFLEQGYVIIFEIAVALFSVSGYEFVVSRRENYPSDYTHDNSACKRYRIHEHFLCVSYIRVDRELLDHDHDIRDSDDYKSDVERARPF